MYKEDTLFFASWILQSNGERQSCIYSNTNKNNFKKTVIALK